MQFIKQDQVQENIIIIRDQRVIVDADVAGLYGLDTREINQAVKNNPEKFPDGYLIEPRFSIRPLPLRGNADGY